MSVFRPKLSGALLAALLVFASCGKSAKDRGGLMLTIAVDEATDIDQLDVKVVFAGEVLHNLSAQVPREAPLPTTLAIVSNDDETAAVEITVVGWFADEPVDRRDAIVTQVPTDRVARLPIVLSGRCSGLVTLNDEGQAVSSCPAQQTCSPETGDCVGVHIESASLTSYQPGDENDLGPTPGGGGADGGGDSGAPSMGGSGVSGSAGSGAGNDGSSGSSGSGGTPVTAGTGGAGGSSGSGGAGGSGGSAPKVACDDGQDNDQDGAIDGFDPECRARVDTDEGSFATGIPGDNIDPQWVDCFFDGNGGGGDDGCHYHHDCVAGTLGPGDPECETSQKCFDFCSVRTPNGCDCYGCCSVWDGASLVDVFITDTCSMAELGNTDLCRPCVKTNFCENAQDTCELALGMTPADLPQACNDTYQCTGATRCGPDVGDCAATEFCASGCCVVDVPPL